MTAPRPKPGELIHRAPDCPLCGDEVGFDSDSFWCEKCGASWTTGYADEGGWAYNSEQCTKVLTHGVHATLSGRCILSDGHGPEHNNGKATWDAQKLRIFRDITESDVEEARAS